MGLPLKKPKKIAIIGTRQPSDYQVKAVQVFFTLLNKSDNKIIIISGCAEGIDATALMMGKDAGYETVGCVPWKNFNKHIQSYCSTINVLESTPIELRTAAYDSVGAYHPNKATLSHGARMLHARNYLIVFDADFVFAIPSIGNNGSFGGTGQGIRIAEALHIPCTVITKEEDINSLILS
jgi:hypothetical protein